jgi:hypothetical protein
MGPGLRRDDDYFLVRMVSAGMADMLRNAKRQLEHYCLRSKRHSSEARNQPQPAYP